MTMQLDINKFAQFVLRQVFSFPGLPARFPMEERVFGNPLIGKGNTDYLLEIDDIFYCRVMPQFFIGFQKILETGYEAVIDLFNGYILSILWLMK